MYKYEEQREKVLTESGAKHLVNIFENIMDSPNGLITIWGATKTEAGDSWEHLACVHFLEEIGKIRIAKQNHLSQYDVIILVSKEEKI